MREAIHLKHRTRVIAADQERSATERALARSMRRSMQKIIAARLGELEPGTALHGRWAALARHLPSCELVRTVQNPLAGTRLGFPFSCRVPGCPYCESARVGALRRRYWPAIRQARQPKAVTLTMRNVPPGALGAGWRRIERGFRRLWRSPLFRGGRCRPGKVGCLAGLTREQRRQRAACGGRCRRRGAARGGAVLHAACRPCPGHRPVSAALLALEATIGSDRASWHPHANLLYDGPFILKRWLDAAWARALDTDTAHTWIRDARKPPSGHRGTWTLEHALHETLKYAVKPDRHLIDSARPAWFVEWVEVRTGLRLVRSYGRWFRRPELSETPDDGEDLVQLQDGDRSRVYRAPRLDPLTDGEADWQFLPGDRPRRHFARFRPPGPGRRRWLVDHPDLRRIDAEEDES